MVLQLKSPSREYVPNVSTFGFFLVIEFPAGKTLPIILKLCLRESTESVATPRYPVSFSTTSELGDMPTGAWHGCPRYVFFVIFVIPRFREILEAEALIFKDFYCFFVVLWFLCFFFIGRAGRIGGKHLFRINNPIE